MKEKRDLRKAAIDVAITEGHEAVWTIAARLAQTVPKHNTEHWFHEIMRTPGKKLNKRAINRWNAFLHGETKKRNAGKFILSSLPLTPSHLCSELPDGVEKFKCTDLIDELREEWAGLSAAEKTERTNDYVKELEEERESYMYGEQNSGFAAFTDMRTTVAGMAVEVCPHRCIIMG